MAAGGHSRFFASTPIRDSSAVRFAEGAWAPGLPDVIRALGEQVLGVMRERGGSSARRLRSLTQFTAGGLSHQAAAAIENACLDIAAKAAGVPVYRLFGGPLRQQIELYWSHCGSFRVRHPELFETVLGRQRITGLPDVKKLGNEAAERGFRAVKRIRSRSPRAVLSC